MVTRELQVSQREKQEILAFEGHLAAASTKQTITESSSLLLSQLTSLEPQYARRGARAGPGLAGAGGGAASWPLSWSSARLGDGGAESPPWLGQEGRDRGPRGRRAAAHRWEAGGPALTRHCRLGSSALAASTRLGHVELSEGRPGGLPLTSWIR